MSKLQKLLASSMLAVFIAGLMAIAPVMAQSHTFSDVDSSDWFHDYVYDALEDGLIDAQAEFRPGDNVTRAEFFKMLALKLELEVGSAEGCTSRFEDVKDGAWYCPYAEGLADMNVISGVGGEPIANPSGDINRGAIFKMLAEAYSFGSVDADDLDMDMLTSFDTGAWWADYFAAGYAICAWDGSADGSKRSPDASSLANRAQAIKFIYGAHSPSSDCENRLAEEKLEVKSANSTSSTQVEVEFSMDLDAACEAGDHTIMDSDGDELSVSGASVEGDLLVLTTATQDSNEDYTITFGDCMSSEGLDLHDDSADFVGYSAVPQGDGDLEVSLSDNSIATTNIPSDAFLQSFLTVNFEATGDAVQLLGAKFMRSGLGSDDDFDECYLALDGVPITNDKSVNDDNELELNIYSPGLTIPENSMVALELICTLDSDTADGRQNRFSLMDNSDVDSNAMNVEGAPVHGSYLTTANFNAGSVQIESKGSDKEVEAGVEGEEFCQFQIDSQSDGTSEEKLYVRTITLENTGGLDTDNIYDSYLTQGGDVVSEMVAVGGTNDYITYKLIDPDTGEAGYPMEDGDNRIFKCKGTVVDGDPSDTIIMNFEEHFDVFVQSDSGFGIRVNNNSGSQLSDVASNTYTLNLGDLTLKKNVEASPSDLDIRLETDDVLFVVGKLTMDASATIEGLDVDVEITDAGAACEGAGGADDADDIADAEARFGDIVIRDQNGGFLASEDQVASTTACAAGVYTATFTFNDNFDLPAGVTDLHFYVDVEDDTNNAADDTFELTINGSDFSGEYSNGENLPAVAGSVNSVTGTLVESQLIWSRTDGLASGDTIVVGAENFHVFSFDVDNDVDAGPVSLRDLSFDMTDADDDYLDDDNDGDPADTGTELVTGCFVAYDIEGTRLVSDLEDMDADENLDFTDLGEVGTDEEGEGVTIPSDSSVELHLFCDFAESIAPAEGFTVAIKEDGSSAYDVDGDELDLGTDGGDDAETLLSSTDWAFAATGDAVFTATSPSMDQFIVTDSQNDQLIEELTIKAVDDTVRVESLAFIVDDDGEAADRIKDVKVWYDGVEICSGELVRKDVHATTGADDAGTDATEESFVETSCDDHLIPAGETHNMEISVSTAQIQDDSQTGVTFGLFLADTFDEDADATFDLGASDRSEVYSHSTDDLIVLTGSSFDSAEATTYAIYNSYPTFDVKSSSEKVNVNQTNVALLAIDVTAHGGDLELGRINVQISASGGTVSNIRATDNSSGSTGSEVHTGVGEDSNSDGAIEVADAVTILTTETATAVIEIEDNKFIVSEGNTKTLYIFGDLSAMTAGTDASFTASVRLDTGTDGSADTYFEKADEANSNALFVWSDHSTDGDSEPGAQDIGDATLDGTIPGDSGGESADWIDGFYLDLNGLSTSSDYNPSS